MLADADADDRYRRRIALGLAVLISAPCLFRCYHGFLSGHHIASLLWFLAAVVFALDYLGVVLSGGPGHLFEWGFVELALALLTSFIWWAFLFTAIHFSLQIMVIVEQLWLDRRADRLAAGDGGVAAAGLAGAKWISPTLSSTLSSPSRSSWVLAPS